MPVLPPAVLSIHVRRKFFDLHKANQSPMALAALNRIAVLYAIEAEGKALSIEERKCLRAEKSLPKLAALHVWLLATPVPRLPTVAVRLKP